MIDYIANGIPNLSVVSLPKNIWRGGNPLTVLGWDCLRNSGLRRVVKLTPDNECPPPDGFDLIRCPITQMAQGGDDLKTLYAIAVDSITDNTFVCCLHGQDRTGVAIALYRLKTGWQFHRADTELMANGFHTDPPQLWNFWKAHAQV